MPRWHTVPLFCGPELVRCEKQNICLYVKQVFCRNPFCLCRVWAHSRDFEIDCLLVYDSRNIRTFWGNLLFLFSSWKMEANRFFWMSADLYQTTCCHISEDSILPFCPSGRHGCYTDKAYVWGKLVVFYWVPGCSGVPTIRATSVAATDRVLPGHFIPDLLSFVFVLHTALSSWQDDWANMHGYR